MNKWTKRSPEKLRILADAAKYDASCASSGSKGRKGGKEGLGSTTGAGICHAYTPDGRCVSLLKILLTNYCLFDCAYCINRRSSNVARARFSVEEVVTLTLEFYKRNYIEGLFLSSGIIKSPDYTMEQLMRVAKALRDQGFAGYIHLKSIPEASPWLIEQAGLYADRMSINLELPKTESLKRLAPEKNSATIATAMGQMQERIIEAKEERRRFSPAGQSTQVIVGADDASDETVLACQRHAVQSLCAAAGLLFRLQPHSRCQCAAGGQAAAAAAGEPAVSGRLAAALLRLHRGGNRRGRRGRHAGSGDRSQAGLGAEAPRPTFLWM